MTYLVTIDQDVDSIHTDYESARKEALTMKLHNPSWIVGVYTLFGEVKTDASIINTKGQNI